MLRHEREDGASIVRTEVSGSTKEQAVVEKHNAAIGILPAVA